MSGGPHNLRGVQEQPRPEGLPHVPHPPRQQPHLPKQVGHHPPPPTHTKAKLMYQAKNQAQLLKGFLFIY